MGVPWGPRRQGKNVFLGTALPLIIVVHTFIRCFGNCVVSKLMPLSTRMREGVRGRVGSNRFGLEGGGRSHIQVAIRYVLL